MWLYVKEDKFENRVTDLTNPARRLKIATDLDNRSGVKLELDS